MKVTEEETCRLQSALENPEFRQLFQSYMDEIQDPKHREENEAYIKQLESGQDVPEGKLIIHPKAEFSVKSWKCSKTQKEKEKVFINIVSSTKISEPVQQVMTGGSKWYMPYSIGPPHMEKDSSSSNVSTFDCCYHPLVLMQAVKDVSGQFRDMMIRTAIEGVQSYYSKAGQGDALVGPEYKVIKNVKYKSGEVSTMVVSAADKDQAWAGSRITESATTETLSRLSSEDTSARLAAATEASSAKHKHVNTSTNSVSKNSTNISDSGRMFKKGFLNYQSISTTTKIVTKTGAAITDTLKLPLPKPTPQAVTTVPSLPISSGDSQIPKSLPILWTDKLSDSSYTNKDYIDTLLLPGQLQSSDSSKSKSVSEVTPKALMLDISADSSQPPPFALSGSQGSTQLSPIMPHVLSVTESNTLATASDLSENIHKQAVKYTLSERGVMTLGDFPPLSRQQQQVEVLSNRPKEIVCRFQVPLAVKPSMLQLDVSERSLLLKYPGVYEQAVRLPYPIKEKDGIAKFDRKIMLLTVTLPVKPPTPMQMSVNQILNVFTHETNNVVEVAREADVAEISDAANNSVSVRQAVDTKTAHNRWIRSPSESEGDAEFVRLRDEIALKVAEARKTIVGIHSSGREKSYDEAQDVPIYENDKIPASDPYSKHTEKTSSSFISVTEVENYGFIECPRFVGAKSGYIYGTRSNGTGYYIDSDRLAESFKSSSSTNAQLTPTLASAPYAPRPFPFYCMETRHTITFLAQVALVVPSSIRVRLIDNRLDISFLTETDTNTGSLHSSPKKTDVSQSLTTNDHQLQSQLQSKQIFYGMSFVLASSDIDPTQLSVNPARTNVEIVIGKLCLTSTSGNPSSPSAHDTPVEYLHTDPTDMLSVVSFQGEDPTILTLPPTLKTQSLEKTQSSTNHSAPTCTNTKTTNVNSENQKSTQISGLDSTLEPATGDSKSVIVTSIPAKPTKQSDRTISSTNISQIKSNDKCALSSLQKALLSLDKQKFAPNNPLLELF